MQERYAAARAISLIPAGELKDKFWIEWKKSVHDAMDALLVEIGAKMDANLFLQTRCCFAEDRPGATFYVEAPFFGWKGCGNSSAYPVLPPYPVPRPLPPNPPFVWNPKQISPIDAYTLQQRWVNADLDVWKAPRTLTPATKAHNRVQAQARAEAQIHAQLVIASRTSVPVCVFSDVVNFATAAVSAPDQVHKVVKLLPYVTAYQ